MISKGKSLISILFILAIFSFSSTALIAQETKTTKSDDKGDKNINELTQSLGSKLNLSEAQQNDVKAALTAYKTETSTAEAKTDAKAMDAAASKTNQKIEASLNPEQKTQWASVKESFWKDVNSKIHGQMPKMEEKQNETY